MGILELLTKTAAAPEKSYAMGGRLYLSKSTGWVLLSVPNALVRGVFDTLQEPGLSLPTGPNGETDAHITVIRGEELEQLGDPKRITERGHYFRYTLGPLRTLAVNKGDLSRVWYVEVQSPELEKLRKSYGLSPLPMNGQYQFHITVALRRKNVLADNGQSKLDPRDVPEGTQTVKLSADGGPHGRDAQPDPGDPGRADAGRPASGQEVPGTQPQSPLEADGQAPAVPAGPGEPGGGDAHGSPLSFINELGNPIGLEAGWQPDGMLRYQLSGPTSTTENIITRMEAERLVAALTPLLQKQAGDAPKLEFDHGKGFWTFDFEESRKRVAEKRKQLEDNDPRIKKPKKGQRVEEFDVCPHCDQEIGEKAIYVDDDGYEWHRGCKQGPIGRMHTREEMAELRSPSRPGGEKKAEVTYWEYACPECGGKAYTGEPETGTRFRGSAKCRSCGHSFAAIRREPSRKDVPASEILSAKQAEAKPLLYRQMARAVKQVAQPTPAQAEAGNYRMGHVHMHGLNISIENKKGGTRSGVDKSGRPWSVTMAHHYGYIRGTKGKDEDHLDVFIGDDPDAELAFVVDQVDPGTGKFDEHKCMLGFKDKKSAKAGYLANYEKGWKGLGGIFALTMVQFKEWIREGDPTKPIAKQIALLKSAEDGEEVLPVLVLHNNIGTRLIAPEAIASHTRV